MSKLSFLNFQYSFSRRFRPKPARLTSRDRQLSNLYPNYEPDMDEMKRVFDKIDKNRDGLISKDEYKFILNALGKKKVDLEVRKAFEAADLNNDGFIDFNEFMDLHQKGINAFEIRRAFWSFDLNRDGKISADELCQVLQQLGERCSVEGCKKMVRAVDTDGDGFVDMNEFMRMMTQNLKVL
ncbi:hypothetical protein Scep_020310 [Stephania cephalantha]|uniref:EF-hand domain-containing protein n=1 Tax=Stephania cephalantha TaxID=152367 RepID=A0AAP0ICE2_9MAGN